MNFCESCNIACIDDICPKCGRKKLREVTDEDFCFVAEVSRMYGRNLKDNLEKENIECALMPYGNGTNAIVGLPLEDYLVYVPYKNLEYVRQLISDKP